MTSTWVLMPAFAKACLVKATASGSSSTMRMGRGRFAVTLRRGLAARRVAMDQLLDDVAQGAPPKPRQDVIDARSTRLRIQILHGRPHHDRHLHAHFPDFLHQ